MSTKKWWLLLPLSVLLMACPFESTVPLEIKPVEPVDSSLLGYWYGIVKDGSDYFGIEALDITRKSDSLYAITRYGKGIKGDMILPDTSYFTGFISYIGSLRFMNTEGYVYLEEPGRGKSREKKKQRVFYVSLIDRKNDTLEVKAVTETFSAKKIFQNPGEFRQLLAEMIGQEKNVFDEQYSLKYRKIEKTRHDYSLR